MTPWLRPPLEVSGGISGSPPPYEEAVGAQNRPLPEDRLQVKVRPAGNENRLLISIVPPPAPVQNIKHVPCDIILVIDVSQSMGQEANLPQERKESTGLSILDLTKHAARTIIETLNSGDRLGVISFSENVKTVQRLTAMNSHAKKRVLDKIDRLKPESRTNLWGGIKAGLGAFDESNAIPGNTRSLFVLTDGQPNHMCPRRGYVPKLKPRFEKARKQRSAPISINTFGFGYDIRSGLLQSIAEVSGGQYAFIPDCGMIGTVFVHAVANLYATCMQDVTLNLEMPQSCESLTPVAYRYDERLQDTRGTRQISIPLGNVIYGQSRDILLEIEDEEPPPDFALSAFLQYFKNGGYHDSPTVDNISNSEEASGAEYLYHVNRYAICDFISSLFPHDGREERRAVDADSLEPSLRRLSTLDRSLRGVNCTGPLNQSLLDDVAGREPKGQVSLALSTPEFFERWGKHYLLSLFNAHQKQLCNSFKDPGPLQYGTKLVLFVKCREKLDDIFDQLPPPKPSLTPADPGTTVVPVGSMTSFNQSTIACFTGKSLVKLADGSHIPISELRPGMEVWRCQDTYEAMGLLRVNECPGEPEKPTRVAAVVKTATTGAEICKLGDLGITPWHPILGWNKWVFPAEYDGFSSRTYGSPERPKYLYSVMLEKDECFGSHQILVGGHWCLTLGHGLTGQPSRAEPRGDFDVCMHPFLGDWDKVWSNLQRLSEDENGVLLSAGVERDYLGEKMIRGFRPVTNPSRTELLRSWMGY